VGYLLGLASIAADEPVPLDLRVADPVLRIGVDVVHGITTVTPGNAPAGAAVVEGRASDVVDRMTGRSAGPVGGDARGLGLLDRFALVLST